MYRDVVSTALLFFRAHCWRMGLWSILFIMETVEGSGSTVRWETGLVIKTLVCYPYKLVLIRICHKKGPYFWLFCAQKFFWLGEVLDEKCGALSVDLQGLTQRGSHLRISVLWPFNGLKIYLILAHLLPLAPTISNLTLFGNAVRTRRPK